MLRNKTIVCAVMVLSLLVPSAKVHAADKYTPEQQRILRELAQLKTDAAKMSKELEDTKAKLAQTQIELERERQKSKSSTKVIKRLEADAEKAENKIALLNEKTQELSGELEAVREQIPADIQESNVYAWHPSANCQIIAWEMTTNDKDERIVDLKILHRKKQDITHAHAVFKATPTPDGGIDEYFLASKLPKGLQVVMPDDARGIWTVNVDRRKGWIKKIDNPDDLANSSLSDGEDNVEGNGKTFESGEAFMMPKQSGMTIRPPIY